MSKGSRKPTVLSSTIMRESKFFFVFFAKTSHSPRCWFYSSSVGVVVRAAALGGRGGRSRWGICQIGRCVEGGVQHASVGAFITLPAVSAPAPAPAPPPRSSDVTGRVARLEGSCVFWKRTLRPRSVCLPGALPRRFCSVQNCSERGLEVRNTTKSTRGRSKRRIAFLL